MSTVAAAFSRAPGAEPQEHASADEKIKYFKRLESWRSDVKKYDLVELPTERTRKLAGIFVGLRRRRHAADYFPGVGEPIEVRQTEAHQKVKDARRFCDLVSDCCGGSAPDSDFVALVSEMLRASIKAPRRS